MTRLLWPVIAGLFITLSALAWAQKVVPPNNTPIAMVCAYNSSLPTITTGNFTYVQCTSSGSLLLH